MVIYLGIDPGKTGAIALINPQKKTPKVYEAKCIKNIISTVLIMRKLGDPYKIKIALEKAQAMPGQGVVSMFNYGVEYGKIIGLLQGYGLEYEEIAPQTWKRKLGLTSDKEKSREMAIKLFPDLKEELSKKKDHNKAEALLLAWHIIQKDKNQ